MGEQKIIKNLKPNIEETDIEGLVKKIKTEKPNLYRHLVALIRLFAQ